MRGCRRAVSGRSNGYVIGAFAALTCFVASSVGCGEGGQGYRSHSFATRNMTASSTDVKLPVALWKKIEDVHFADASRAGSAVSAEGAPTEFMPIKVLLIEKSRGILGERNHELLFEEGGGEVDLKSLVVDKKGTFSIAFEPVVAGAERPPKVFYLSNAIRRRVGNVDVGAGCDGYFDITSFFTKAMKHDGIEVNTTAGRHVSVLAGTYFFAVPHDGKLHVAQVTIKDSRYRSLHCRR